MYRGRFRWAFSVEPISSVLKWNYEREEREFARDTRKIEVSTSILMDENRNSKDRIQNYKISTKSGSVSRQKAERRGRTTFLPFNPRSFKTAVPQVGNRIKLDIFFEMFVKWVSGQGLRQYKWNGS